MADFWRQDRIAGICFPVAIRETMRNAAIFPKFKHIDLSYLFKSASCDKSYRLLILIR